jgi:Flp pilus assembly protein TadD
VRVFNNLGIIQKRQGDIQLAQENYKKALDLEPNSFFPNYNMGVLLSLDRSRHADSIQHLKIALE